MKLSGLVSLIGEEGSPPVQSRPGQGDHMAALNLLAAVLAALRLRDRDGVAQYVDVALQRTGVWSVAADIQQALNRDEWNFERQDRSKHWLLTRNTNCRIFSDMTLADILTKVFQEIPGLTVQLPAKRRES